MTSGPRRLPSSRAREKLERLLRLADALAETGVVATAARRSASVQYCISPVAASASASTAPSRQRDGRPWLLPGRAGSTSPLFMAPPLFS